MSKLTIRLPETLHKQIRKLATEEGISINQFITLAATGRNSKTLLPPLPMCHLLRATRSDGLRPSISTGPIDFGRWGPFGVS